MMLLLPVFIFINTYINNESEKCIIWLENHFEKSACSQKKSINNSFYKINIEEFKKIEVTAETLFFKNENPLVWYGKSPERKIDFFTQRGIHPITLKELNPITEYIISKYVLNE